MAGEEYLVNSLLMKPARNNDITKWDNFAKIEALSEKINNAKRTKNDLFDLTITVSMEGTPKVSLEENLKPVNQRETKVYKYFNTKKDEKRPNYTWRL